MMRKWTVVLVVLSLIGIVMLSGCLGDQSNPQTTTAPTGTKTQVPVNITVKPTKQITIPVTGVFVKVSYLGGFSGTYGMNNDMQNVRNSGDKLYEIVNATGNVSATFKKEDGSTKHDITVELLIIAASVTGAVGSVTGSVGSVTAEVSANVTKISSDATAADNAQAFFDGTGYAGTNNTIPTVTTVTNSVAITDATSDAVIADAVWNGAVASYGTAGTYGALIESGNVGNGAIVAASVTGAVGSVTGAVGSVTGSVGSVATGGITTASFAAGAINAAAIATGAIDADAIADDAGPGCTGADLCLRPTH